MKTRMFAVCVVIVLFFGIANAEISDGLVAYHPFNGNAHDESGHGNNRTVSGATLAMDTSGSMISAMPSGPYTGWSAQSETQGSVPIITSETGSFMCFPRNSSDGTLNIPTVYTVGISKFVSNSIGPRNTIYISDFTGWFGSTDGTVIKVRAWDVSGAEIPESGSSAPLKLHNYGTTNISGSDLAARFPSGSPMTYEFTVGSSGSSGLVITNVKSSSDGSINIPTVYTHPLESGVTYSYLTNYISDLNTIQITDMSGNISTDGAIITIKARDVAGNIIPESSGATALKLYNYGTTTIEGKNLQNRFSGGVPATYQFYTDSSNAVVTNLTKSLDGTINIPTVFNTGYQEGGI